MLLKGFFDRYPKFRQHADNPAADSLLTFMSDPENIERMMLLNDFAEMAPLSAIVENLEQNFESQFDLHSLDIRQMIGSMVKEALLPFGYEPFDRTLVRNSRYFKVSARYRKTCTPIFRLKKKYEIVDAKK